jgi:hypothetical protein
MCAEIPEYCDCCGKFVWLSDGLENWEETWELTPGIAAEDFTS